MSQILFALLASFLVVWSYEVHSNFRNDFSTTRFWRVAAFTVCMMLVMAAAFVIGKIH